MQHSESDRSLPSRWEELLFSLKALVFQARRVLKNIRHPLRKHPKSDNLCNSLVVAEFSAPLWNQISDAEFPLTAGKVHNLRVACAALNGVEIPADGTFSFWQQIGHISSSHGYTVGRELRSGCLVPNIGGGLCALSGLLYAAALKSHCSIIERHAHSRSLPGMSVEPERDATIFWNYVDLRFQTSSSLRIETELNASQLIVRFRRAETTNVPIQNIKPLEKIVHQHASGDCLTCGMISCFRHPSATTQYPPNTAHAAFLLDSWSPEIELWCQQYSHAGDQWHIPLDGIKWKKPNYAWKVPSDAIANYLTWFTLLNAWKTRRLPQQGEVRQKTLLQREADLADRYARALATDARHLFVSQNLLPHLHANGALGGRTYDVLMQRMPLEHLHQLLDEATKKHPTSQTINDFRADDKLLKAEKKALSAAARFVTPHRAIAKIMGDRSILLDWIMPPVPPRNQHDSATMRIFFPCSPLARKGVYELADALSGMNAKLFVLGKAKESGTDPLANIEHHSASIEDLYSTGMLILPAWVEHQPRIALRALSAGIPVIATRACGLANHPLLTEIDQPDATAIKECIAKILAISKAS